MSSEELPYEPEVNDYVIWEQTSWSGTTIDEGWVYFKAPKFEDKKGFNTPARYITIETSVRDKPKEQLEDGHRTLHKKIHTLLLCYEHQWKDLKFVKRRQTKECHHYSQYDDIEGLEQ